MTPENIKLQAYTAQIEDEDFRKIQAFVEQTYGIKLPSQKRDMVQGRLHKRLIANNMSSFRDYTNYLFSPEGSLRELSSFINAISTNKTNFFRENNHFKFLTDTVINDFVEDSNRPLNIWSAACSSGEECYSIAMSIQEAFGDKIDYKILGSDISTQMLSKAKEAIYTDRQCVDVPYDILRKYFLKSKDPQKKMYRITKNLRQKCSFKRLNLMDEEYKIPKKFDIVFLRNVLIYFEKQTQKEVMRKVLSHMPIGGILFIGHSESLISENLPLKVISPSVYKKINHYE